MWAVYLAWFLLSFAASLAAGLLWQQIVDDVEEGLPLDQRPSWQPFGERHPRSYWDTHRRTRPSSPLRKWYAVSMACTAAMLFSGSVALVAFNRPRHRTLSRRDPERAYSASHR